MICTNVFFHVSVPLTLQKFFLTSKASCLIGENQKPVASSKTSSCRHKSQHEFTQGCVIIDISKDMTFPSCLISIRKAKTCERDYDNRF